MTKKGLSKLQILLIELEVWATEFLIIFLQMLLLKPVACWYYMYYYGKATPILFKYISLTWLIVNITHLYEQVFLSLKKKEKLKHHLKFFNLGNWSKESLSRFSHNVSNLNKLFSWSSHLHESAVKPKRITCDNYVIKLYCMYSSFIPDTPPGLAGRGSYNQSFPWQTSRG